MQTQSSSAEPIQAFMSHKSCDKPFAERLAGDLRAKGIKTWLDDWSLPPGIPLTDAMQDGIEGSDVMLLVLTPPAVAAIRAGAGGLAFEVHIGEDRCFADSRFRIIGLQKEDCDPPPKLRNRIGKWLDFRAEDVYEERVNELVFWIKKPDGDRGPETKVEKDTSSDTTTDAYDTLRLAVDSAMVSFGFELITRISRELLSYLDSKSVESGILLMLWQELTDATRNFLLEFEHSDDMNASGALQRLRDFLFDRCGLRVTYVNRLQESMYQLLNQQAKDSIESMLLSADTRTFLMILHHDAQLCEQQLMLVVARARNQARIIEQDSDN